ncbi:CD63 antigen-like [Liolophura sinensis]|uniref:CD63 antigen-like n=1 Tax=Liolophura sinensis TaxID=3198878 RepID=UPI003158A95B
MVEGGMKCIKYLLFVFNLIFVIAAIGLIIIGALVQTRFHEYFDFFGGKFNGAAILLIIVGVVIFMIAFFGCCGAIRENYICTMVFAVMLIVIFILELAGGIAGFVLRNSLEGEVRDLMMEAQKNYNDTQHEGVTKTWDEVQRKFKCCGVVNYTDWNDNERLHGGVPDSCCLEFSEGCGKAPVNPGKIYDKGCLDFTVNWAKDNIYIVGAAGIGLAFIQIVGIIFACCLARSIKKEYEVV